MLRFLNIAVLTLLVGAAAWAYQTKYETIYFAEQVKKLESKVEKERDQIAILKAEWQLLNRPARMEQLAEQYAADLKPVKPVQVARAQDLPDRSRNPVDQIAARLDSLIATGSISSAPSAKAASLLPKAPRPPATPIARTPKAGASVVPKTVKQATPIPAARIAAAPADHRPALGPPKSIRQALTPTPAAPPRSIRHATTPAPAAAPPRSIRHATTPATPAPVPPRPVADKTPAR